MLNENRTILLEKLLRKCELLVKLNMKNNGAPGNDKINAFYIKKTIEYPPSFKSLPQYLVRGKTILLPKNIDTKLTKNQRPLTTKLTKNQHA